MRVRRLAAEVFRRFAKRRPREVLQALVGGPGHLWHTLFGWEGDPHFDPFHIASYVLIGGGFSGLAADPHGRSVTPGAVAP